MFKKYMHVERFGNDEVQGIELGGCYVFPKLDGTNASIWLENSTKIKAGSRKRELTLDADNAGFYEWVRQQENIFQFFKENPYLRLYGEWLVPHSLKTYREDAWRKFYVFDVMIDTEEKFISYEEYKPLLEKFDIKYIPPLCTIKNASYENLLRELNDNTFLIVDGSGVGEGIVIKNYEYTNRFDRTIWAKIVTNQFKEKHKVAMGFNEKEGKKMVEQFICDEYVTAHLVNKVYSKIVNEMEGWNSKYIPRLLSTVFYDIVNEELWNAIKKLKNPTINFKTLQGLSILKIKELRAELF